MSSSTFTVRVDEPQGSAWKSLPRESTGRSRSFLAAEAITEYLAVQEWQVEGIKQAIASLDRGDTVPHLKVKDWVASWDSQAEHPAPKRSEA
jgi:RHH-type rel operon transcriptional repressor/antitoxin RelB